MSTRDLLIEIGSEELPPKALNKLSDAFTAGVVAGLADAQLQHGDVESYASPRRLAILIRDLEEAQADREIDRRGPNVKAALDKEGNVSKAAEGFARSCGVSFEELDRITTDKGEFLFYKLNQPGKPTPELIPDIVRQSLQRLPIPKRMRWGAGDAEFVRPVKWVAMLFGQDVIDCEILSVQTSNTTRGHRFHSEGDLAISAPAAYAETLRAGHVEPSYAARVEKVREQVIAAAKDVGCEVLMDEELLEEVAALVEWPVPVVGTFDASFLELPDEVLINTVKDHQRYFVAYKDGALSNYFITISNIESVEPDVVRAGNEKVVYPRLADALFFWNQDRAQPLASRRDKLANVVFQKELGSQLEKSDRVSKLAGKIAADMGVDVAATTRAADIGRCDLQTNIVFEIPELQGVIGRYYAKLDGEPEAVAEALFEQYLPRFADDDLPATGPGRALALAEKLDTIAGSFAIGKKPTGDKDPFGLRRAALGCLKILLDAKLALPLDQLIADALAGQPVSVADDVADDIFTFFQERTRVMMVDQGVKPEIVAAVLACRPTVLADTQARVSAVQAFMALPDAEPLAAANKRIGNILKKSKDPIQETIDTGLLSEDAEKALHEKLTSAQTTLAPAIETHDYQQVLTHLAALREPVDNYFDNVMVNADDPALKANRLAMLSQLRGLFLVAADLSLV